MLIDTVTWSGNATDDRAITFTGDLASVTPTMVLIDGGSSTVNSVWTSDTIDAAVSGESAYLHSATANATGLIKSRTSGGFTVGTSAPVNQSGKSYFAVGFYDDGNDDFETFTYTGTGSDDENFDILLGQPHFLAIKKDDATRGVTKFEAQTGDASHVINAGQGVSSNLIQAFRSLGFQVGGDGTVNDSGLVYHGFAFYGVDGFVDVHTYTGNGSTQSITVQDTTFEPTFALVCREPTASHVASYHHTTDLSFQWTDGIGDTTGQITDRTSVGFDVGGSALVNTNAVVYNYLAARSNPNSGGDGGGAAYYYSQQD